MERDPLLQHRLREAEARIDAHVARQVEAGDRRSDGDGVGPEPGRAGEPEEPTDRESNRLSTPTPAEASGQDGDAEEPVPKRARVEGANGHEGPCRLLEREKRKIPARALRPSPRQRGSVLMRDRRRCWTRMILSTVGWHARRTPFRHARRYRR